MRLADSAMLFMPTRLPNITLLIYDSHRVYF